MKVRIYLVNFEYRTHKDPLLVPEAVLHKYLSAQDVESIKYIGEMDSQDFS